MEEPPATNLHEEFQSYMITAFSEITSCSREEALFFLQSHNFDLHSAITTFFDTTTTVSSPPSQKILRSPSPSRSASPMPSLDFQLQTSVNACNRRSRDSNVDKKPSGGRNCNIYDPKRPDADNSLSESDEPLVCSSTYDKSGMCVQDPSRVKDVEPLFYQTRRPKAEEANLDRLQPSGETAAPAKLVRKSEDYPVTQYHIAFHGVGRTLGNIVSEDPPAAATALNAAPAPPLDLVVDETLPSTSIQLRLVDGTCMVSRFNHHHTINDIRSFIDASRPGGPRGYQLLKMGFPSKQLNDLNQTIEQAGVANSVVIQKP